MELHSAVARWFARTYPNGPTEAQALAIPLIEEGENVLVSSPTGTGKTLAAFLAILSDLFSRAEDDALPARVDTIYVSPLKALANDIARNLDAPLRGIEAELGWPPGRVTTALRTGETSPRARERMAKQPPHILVTTPESLALLLLSPRWVPWLRTVRRVIVDEVHAVADTKRGAHLALALERLEARADAPLQRIGMSATVRPLDEAARFLAGGRPCRAVAVKASKDVSLAAGLTHPTPMRASGGRIEDAFYERLDRTIEASRSTLVFTNTRRSSERVVMELRRRYGEKYGTLEDDESTSLVAPHHGSMSKESRVRVEERLVSGDLKCVVTSSSLELGVHVDDVDDVVMLGSPKYASRALQRVGRSGHRVGARARGVMLASEPDELAECAAVAALAARREVEPLRVPFGGFDVLAQHLVALAVERERTVDEALALTRRAWPYRDLRADDLDALLRYLRDDAKLLLLDGERFTVRHGGARVALARGGGTIPNAGLVRVLHGARFVGEVEEAFVEELQVGDIFQLAGEPWRYVSHAVVAIHVEPARGREPTVPEWKSEGLAASPQVVEEMRRLLEGGAPPEGALEDGSAEVALAEFVALQRRVAALPARDELLVEQVRTDLGSRALVLHAMLGRRANEALGRAIRAQLLAGAMIAGETGVAIVGVPDRLSAAAVRALFDGPILDALAADVDLSEAFRRRFRHVAERALLVRGQTRGVAQRKAGYWAKRWRALDPEHPLLREARREVLEGVMDAEGAEAFRRAVAGGAVKLRMLPAKPQPSPYAACILVPRGGSIGQRAAELRDLFERWETREGAPRPWGEARMSSREAPGVRR